MEYKSKKLGRPRISQDEKSLVFQKLEPYLKIGLSLNKACALAQISKSRVYQLKHEDEDFMEKIVAANNYHTVLVSSILIKELEKISSKQSKSIELSSSDIKFVQWLAVNSVSMRDEYGETDLLERQEDGRFASFEDNRRKILQDPKAVNTLLEAAYCALEIEKPPQTL